MVQNSDRHGGLFKQGSRVGSFFTEGFA